MTQHIQVGCSLSNRNILLRSRNVLQVQKFNSILGVYSRIIRRILLISNRSGLVPHMDNIKLWPWPMGDRMAPVRYWFGSVRSEVFTNRWFVFGTKLIGPVRNFFRRNFF